MASKLGDDDAAAFERVMQVRQHRILILFTSQTVAASKKVSPRSRPTWSPRLLESSPPMGASGL